MIYTQNIQKAISFAIKIHQLDQNQTRKGTNIPYIIHPLSLGIILARAGAEEDIVIAGILHDTIEDSVASAKVTKEIIAKEFGENIAEMVNDVTEQDKSLPWIVRKQHALEHIPQMENDSLMVKSADVLHNLRDQIADYKQERDAMFKRFNKEASKEMRLEHYRKLVDALNVAWIDNPLLPELEQAYKEVKELWSSIQVQTPLKELANRWGRAMVSNLNKQTK